MKTWEEIARLDRVAFGFTQEENCMSNHMGGTEEMTIECVSDIGISNSEDFFFVIKTDQWSFDSIDELKKLTDRIEKSINLFLKSK